jgi:hypothetical protein
LRQFNLKKRPQRKQATRGLHDTREKEKEERAQEKKSGIQVGLPQLKEN